MDGAPWRIAMASSIGTSHIVTGAPCQDSHDCQLVRSADGAKVLIATVSDGAGSARFSDVGSKLTCELFCQLAGEFIATGGQVNYLEVGTVRDWLDHIVERLATQAMADGNPVKEYACTLLAVIAGEESTAYVQIGDGAIVVSKGLGARWDYAFWPQHGEFANTTNFLVSPGALDKLDFVVGSGRVEEVALFTDGLENLVLHNATRSVHEPFFNAVFKSVRASQVEGRDKELSERLRAYLSSQVISDRTDDDKTLILASRVPKEVSEELTAT